MSICCAATSMGRCPAACTASVWNSTPFSRQTAPISPIGRIDPISLLAYIRLTRQVSGRMASCHLLRRDRPNRADRQELDLKAVAPQLVQRVEHGVVLKGRGDDVPLAPPRADGRR